MLSSLGTSSSARARRGQHHHTIVIKSKSSSGGGATATAGPPCETRVLARIRPLLPDEKGSLRLSPFASTTNKGQPLSPTSTLSTVDTFDSDEASSSASPKEEHAKPAQQAASLSGSKEQSTTPQQQGVFWSENESPTPKDSSSSLLEGHLRQNHGQNQIESEVTPLMRNTRNKEAPESSISAGVEEEAGSVFESTPMLVDSQGHSTDVHRKNGVVVELDAVLNAPATQTQTYQHANVKELLQTHVLQGRNATVMAYGSACGGKTYTLFGPTTTGAMAQSPATDGFHQLQEHDGIFSRAIFDLLEAKRQQQGPHSCLQVHLACCELRQDCIKDLLLFADDNGKKPPRLSIRDLHDADGPIVHGLRSIPLVSLRQARHAMHQAMEQSRQNSPTGHVVACITVRLLQQQGSPKDSTTTSAVQQAKLTLVDMASSDREFANQDLRVLDKIVSVLGGEHREQRLPFRESKLTRLLRDSLPSRGANTSGSSTAATVLISCISPTNVNDEAMNALDFAQRFKTVSQPPPQGKPEEAPDQQKLQSENKKLNSLLTKYKKRLQRLQHKTGESMFDSDGGSLASESRPSPVSQRKVDAAENDEEDDDEDMSSLESGCWSASTDSTSWRKQQALSKALRSKLEQAQEKALAARMNSAHLMEQVQDLRKQVKKDPMSSPSSARSGQERESGGFAIDSVDLNRSLDRSLDRSMDSSVESSVVVAPTANDVALDDANSPLKDIAAREQMFHDDPEPKQQQQQQGGEGVVAAGDTLDIRRRTVLSEIAYLENMRDELNLEVEWLMFRVNLLSTGARRLEREKQDSSPTQSISSILRSLSAEEQKREEPLHLQSTNDGQSSSSPRSLLQQQVQDELSQAEQHLKREKELAQSYNNLLEGQVQILRQQEQDSRISLQQQLREEQDKLAKAEARHEREKEQAKSYNSLLQGQVEILRQHVQTMEEQRQPWSPQQPGENAALQAEVKALRAQVSDLQSRNAEQQEVLDQQQQEESVVYDGDANSAPMASHELPVWYRRRLDRALVDTEEIDVPEEEGAQIIDSQPQQPHWSSEQLEASSDDFGASFNEADLSIDTAPGTDENQLGTIPEGQEDSKNDEQLVLLNAGDNLDSSDLNHVCSCQNGAPMGNMGSSERADFYLPKLSVVCSCGKITSQQQLSKEHKRDPYDLSHILRDWQVDFLAEVDITQADTLVKVAERKAGRLAKLMRKWRKDQGMEQYELKSCMVAIHIWAKTCQSVIRAVTPPRKSVLEYHVTKSSSSSVSSSSTASSARRRQRHTADKQVLSPIAEQDFISAFDDMSGSAESYTYTSSW